MTPRILRRFSFPRAHFIGLYVLFRMSPRSCKLVKKWLSYGQKRGFARTFFLRSAHFIGLYVLFRISPRSCKLVKKWLSYGQKRGFARTFFLRSG
eukprot:sb/3479252/